MLLAHLPDVMVIQLLESLTSLHVMELYPALLGLTVAFIWPVVPFFRVRLCALTDDGYVDFEVTYTPTNGTPVVTTKRFSISKSPDGRAGSSYNLQVSANVLQKSKRYAYLPARLRLTRMMPAPMTRIEPRA